MFSVRCSPRQKVSPTYQRQGRSASFLVFQQIKGTSSMSYVQNRIARTLSIIVTKNGAWLRCSSWLTWSSGKHVSKPSMLGTPSPAPRLKKEHGHGRERAAKSGPKDPPSVPKVFHLIQQIERIHVSKDCNGKTLAKRTWKNPSCIQVKAVILRVQWSTSKRCPRKTNRSIRSGSRRFSTFSEGIPKMSASTVDTVIWTTIGDSLATISINIKMNQLNIDAHCAMPSMLHFIVQEHNAMVDAESQVGLELNASLPSKNLVSQTIDGDKSKHSLQHLQLKLQVRKPTSSKVQQQISSPCVQLQPWCMVFQAVQPAPGNLQHALPLRSIVHGHLQKRKRKWSFQIQATEFQRIFGTSTSWIELTLQDQWRRSCDTSRQCRVQTIQAIWTMVLNQQKTFDIFEEGKQHLRILQSSNATLRSSSSSPAPSRCGTMASKMRSWMNFKRSISTWCAWLVNFIEHIVLKDGFHSGKQEPISHNHLQFQSTVLLQLRLQFQLKMPPQHFQWKQLRRQGCRCPAIKAWLMLQGTHHSSMHNPRHQWRFQAPAVQHASLQPLACKREFKKHSHEMCKDTKSSKEECMYRYLYPIDMYRWYCVHWLVWQTDPCPRHPARSPTIPSRQHRICAIAKRGFW